MFLVFALAGLAAIFGLLLIQKHCRESDPREAKVKEFLHALGEGDHSAAYRCTSDKFREKVSPARFGQVLEASPLWRAKGFQVERGRYISRSGPGGVIVDAKIDTDAGAVPLVFYVYRTMMGGDFLVGHILVRGNRLFAEEIPEF